MLVNIAAKWIDDIRHECNCSGHHLKGNIQARLISTIVFPIFAAIDTVYLTVLTLKDLICLDLTQAKEHVILARKCFDGFLFSPFSLIYSDICSRHFIPKREEAEGVVRPHGQLYAMEVEEIRPETVEEVQKIVKEAGGRKGHVTVAGARFSQGKQILPSKPGQVLLDMTHPNFKKIEINGNVARVGAGVVWRELQVEANKKGLAVQVQQASNVFSVTGTDAEWLQEFFVKREDLEEFIKVLGKTLDKNQVKLLNASVRYIKPDHTSHLSYARKEEKFAIVLFFTQQLSPKEISKTKAWVRKTIDYLQARGGTYYLPYQHFATKEQFRKSYPQWARVVYKKRKYDPKDVFHTGLYDDYFKTKRNIVLRKA